MDAEQRSDLTKYLTEEISSHTQVQVAQRTRNNLIFALGPFLIVGALSTNDTLLDGLRRMPDTAFFSVLAFVLALYLLLGVLGGFIEKKVWEKCNEWRADIARIQGCPELDFTFESCGLVWVYVAIFGAVGSTVVAFLYLLKGS